MSSSESTRRHSAILLADAVGYSRLMGLDVDFTVEAIKASRRIFSDILGRHGGRVVNAPGDSILAEIENPVEAVQSAVEIQSELEKRNAGLPAERRMDFRIGISVGPIVAEGDAIYGDEVNVAARLEGLSEPGGICISSGTHEVVQDRLQLQYEFLGEHQLKNIVNPVPVYRVLYGAAARSPRKDNVAASRLNKPSIAVLPFTVIGGDADQEYFADGITEDIITELSRFKSLFVIARNSSFSYKGRAVQVQQVARDLGVQYVLEGSVRKAGNRVRITAQLIDAIDGSHLWAEKYDRELKDVFAIQDEIGQTIVANIPRRLESANLERSKRKNTENLAAWDFFLRGKDHHHRHTATDNVQALEMLDKAIELDPDFAEAYAWKACTLGQAFARGFRKDRTELFTEALDLAQKSCELDDDDSEGHRILCEIHLLQRRYDQSLVHHERAIALNPNDPRIVAQRGQLFSWTGKADEGVSWLEMARRLDPFPPDLRADSLGQALFTARRYEEGLRAYRLIGAPMPRHLANLAACYAMLERKEEAAAEATRVRAQQADFSAQPFVESLPYQFDADREHHVEALRRAGLD
ncbi:MAG: adenylate/guanylate cyclase domain-containing protein [bacterium]